MIEKAPNFKKISGMYRTNLEYLKEIWPKAKLDNQAYVRILNVYHDEENWIEISKLNKKITEKNRFITQRLGPFRYENEFLNLLQNDVRLVNLLKDILKSRVITEYFDQIEHRREIHENFMKILNGNDPRTLLIELIHPVRLPKKTLGLTNHFLHIFLNSFQMEFPPKMDPENRYHV
jgi:hypothetical protein